MNKYQVNFRDLKYHGYRYKCISVPANDEADAKSKAILEKEKELIEQYAMYNGKYPLEEIEDWLNNNPCESISLLDRKTKIV